MKKPFLILIVSASVFMSSYYGDVIFHPNSVLFNDSGDAIKNYYTYAYHIEHDEGYSHSSAMNHPYGEHILYLDCHPALSTLLKLTKNILPAVSSYSIGILNFLMILSIFSTFIILYFLLLELEFNPWIAVLFSFSITLLAPQIFRLTGHLSLSYSIVIPLVWLLYLQSIRASSLVKTLWLCLVITVALFTHAYLGMMAVLLCTLLYIQDILFKTFRSHNSYSPLLLFSSFSLPAVLFLLFKVLTDFVPDRTDNPSGFFSYNAELDDVFIPHHGPIRSLLDLLSGNTINQEWDAWSYIGFSGTLLFGGLILLFLWNAVFSNKRVDLSHLSANRKVNMALVAGTIILLFAMAIPFRQIPSLLDLVPMVKQFRATGRFSWVFFFTASVFIAFAIQSIVIKLKSNGKKWMAVTLLIAIVFLNTVEAIPYHRETYSAIVTSANSLQRNAIPNEIKEQLTNIDPNEYQAILALPYYHFGSESFARPPQEESVYNSMLFSFHSGLPMMNNISARTSIGQSKNLVQALSPSFYFKELQEDLQDERPILLLRSEGKLSPYEELLIAKAEVISSGESMNLLSISSSDLFESDAEQIIDRFYLSKDSLYSMGEFLSTDSSFYHYGDFENNISDTSFAGIGAFTGYKRDQHLLAEFSENTFEADTDYHISIWMYNAEPDALNLWFRLMIDEYDSATDTWHSTTIFPEHAETIFDDWSLVEGTFKLKNTGNRIYVVTRGKNDSEAAFHADELLIRNANSTIYRLDSEADLLFMNNHRIPMNSATN